MSVQRVTCTAPVNIAVIKYCKFKAKIEAHHSNPIPPHAGRATAFPMYLASCRTHFRRVQFLGFFRRFFCLVWSHSAQPYLGGKRDTKLLLPINDSLSGTLSQDEVRAAGGPARLSAAAIAYATPGACSCGPIT